jgi:hypothetical protein
MRRLPVTTAARIVRQEPVQQAAQIIARHELRVWFEPRWADARRLAIRFPRCLVCSIPTESDTINLHRVPGWRPQRDRGVV